MFSCRLFLVYWSWGWLVLLVRIVVILLICCKWFVVFIMVRFICCSCCFWFCWVVFLMLMCVRLGWFSCLSVNWWWCVWFVRVCLLVILLSVLIVVLKLLVIRRWWLWRSWGWVMMLNWVGFFRIWVIESCDVVLDFCFVGVLLLLVFVWLCYVVVGGYCLCCDVFGL